MARSSIEGKVPVVLGYAISIYEQMELNSKMVKAHELYQYGYPTNDNEDVRVFFGYSQDAAKAAKITHGSVTGALSLLNAMRSATLLKPGGQRHTSVYVLHYKPTMETYNQWRADNGQVVHTTIPSKYEMVLADLERANERIGKLEAEVKNIWDAFSNIVSNLGREN